MVKVGRHLRPESARLGSAVSSPPVPVSQRQQGLGCLRRDWGDRQAATDRHLLVQLPQATAGLALVTGAGRGIGRAVASNRVLIVRNAHQDQAVVAADRDRGARSR